MITRRKTIQILSAGSAAMRFTATRTMAFAAPNDDTPPPLAPGTPNSPARLALIETFKKQSDGLDKKFEARTHKGSWTMPYRLFKPEASGKVPLVIYLHGSGGQGDDNLKQLGLGNIFGTRVCLLPENQKAFPCYVLAPQSNRGWVRYDPAKLEKDEFEMVPGPGQGVAMVLEIIDELRHELQIDDRRIYVMASPWAERARGI